MAKGYPAVVRSTTHEIFCCPADDLVRKVCGRKKKSNNYLIHKILKKINDYCDRDGYLHKTQAIMKVEQLISEIIKLNVKPCTSEWSKYYCGENELPVYNGCVDSLETVRKATAKHQYIDNLLEKLKPETVLDIGCNRGLFSQIAASRGAKVIGIDMDEMALDQMYNDSKMIGNAVLPLYVNAVAPVEAIGFKEIPFATVTDRLRSECVLCLALVHHLVFKRTQMNFLHIAKVLSSYSKKYLIVEFVPKEDKHVSEWYTDE